MLARYDCRFEVDEEISPELRYILGVWLADKDFIEVIECDNRASADIVGLSIISVSREDVGDAIVKIVGFPFADVGVAMFGVE